MASSLMSREDVEEELDFTDVLIQSLDSGADDYEERLAELEETKDQLKGRLAAFSNAASHSQEQNGGSGGRTVEDMDAESPEWGWPSSLPQENGHPQNGLSTTNGTSNGPYAGMKRPAADILRSDSEHPSKRPTPEPSNVPTPNSSVESLDASDNANERARRRQLAAEAAYRRQRESQAADERLARELSQPQNTMANVSSSSSQRPAIQTTLNHNGLYQRPPPPQKPEFQVPVNRGAYRLPPGHRPSSSGQHLADALPTPSSVSRAQLPNVKSEPSRPGLLPGFSGSPHSIRPRGRSDVVDLTNSDDEEDVTEIDRTGFTPNSRVSRPVVNNPSGNPYGGPLPVRGLQRSQFGGASRHVPGAYPTVQQNPYQSVYGNIPPTANGVHGQQQSWLGSANSHYHRAMESARVAASRLANPISQAAGLLGVNSFFELDDDDDDGQYSRRYNELVDNNPEKTREEINALLENIRPDEEIPAHLRVQTPEAMSIKLHKYQELGLTWLKKCEEGSNKGGILADEMGLGKTIQMLALIVTHKSEDPRCKTTLIIAPVALMRQWKQEIEQKLKPRHRLTVFTQHGQSKKKSFHDLRTYDIVLSTYGTLGAEVKKLEQFRLRQRHDPTARPTAREQCALLGDDANWYRVILDEAQCIKNRNTRTAQAAGYLNAKYRFCMTGTPMMNNVGEFYSLIKFLRINPYCRWEKFRLDIAMALDNKSKSSESDGFQAAMSRLQALCKAVMIRRTKKSEFEGEPILVLPEISREIENPVFDQDELDFYSAVEGKMQIQFNKYLAAGEVGQKYTAILVLLLRLRQAACHPHLIKDFSIAAAADITEDQVIEFAKSLEPAVVARIKAAGGNFECPVCYDVVENPAIFIPCGHDTCRECFTRITDPSNAIREGRESGSDAKCPNCRSPIDPKRVTDFDAFKRVHMRELLTEDERKELEDKEAEIEVDDDEDGDDSEDNDSDSDSDDADENEVDSKGNLLGFVVNDDEEEPEPESDATEEAEGLPGPSTKSKKVPKPKKSKSKKGKGKGKKGKGPKTKKKEVNLADLAKLSQRNQKARRKYLRRLRETYVDSAKIRKTMELLQTIMADPAGEKVLVFSQWTSLLDLVEIPIDGNGWDYRRYDGSMSAKMRADAVDDFRDHRKNVRIMLVSLKAGNAGLNLTAASQVIILDPFWNPYIEEQAIDRAHRIGQEREVKVHRMLIKQTIEDRIVAIQENKRALITAALDEQQAQNIGRLGVQELAYLFGVTSAPDESVQYRARRR